MTCREMVHAIDGLWQVFKLQWSSSMNDLFRIAAKTGILLRLISTLYSLNEAAQLASISIGGGFLFDTVVSQQTSSDPEIFLSESMVSGINFPNYCNVKPRKTENSLLSVTSFSIIYHVQTISRTLVYDKKKYDFLIS